MVPENPEWPVNGLCFLRPEPGNSADPYNGWVVAKQKWANGIAAIFRDVQLAINDDVRHPGKSIGIGYVPMGGQMSVSASGETYRDGWVFFYDGVVTTGEHLSECPDCNNVDGNFTKIILRSWNLTL